VGAAIGDVGADIGKSVVPHARTITSRLRQSVRHLHPHYCLLLLAIPLALVEPLKVTGFVALGKGHWSGGLAILTTAYILSISLLTGLFNIVQPRLLTLSWFRTARDRFLQLRSTIFDHTAVLTVSLLAIVLVVSIKPAQADDSCHRLEALAQEYAGVTLSTEQERLKHRLIIWYKENCRERRAADAR
jgi:hypothetical protein